MSENSLIQWCDHTFNPWIGCTKVSAGCKNCYAEAQDKRRFSMTMPGCSKENPIIHFGKGAPRYRTSDRNWKMPLRWNKDCVCQNGHIPMKDARGGHGPYLAEFAGTECCECGAILHRPRVFCASLADWLDDEVPIEWLADLLALIDATPNLDWLLLTKRPQNWRPRLEGVHDMLSGETGNPPCGFGHPMFNARCLVNSWLCGPQTREVPGNVWIGTTVENQEMADKRIPILLSIPAKVRFLSCEPLLGPIEFSDVTKRSDAVRQLGRKSLDGIHWVICGGESGPGARPMHSDWARSLRDQCQAAGVPFLFKQWGEFAPCEPPVVTNVEGKLQATGSWKAKDIYVECRETGQWLKHVGKKSAGRLLDGREWNEFPQSI